jgi:hypothetical protein
MLPSEYRSLSIEDRAELFGLYVIEKEIESYNASEQLRISESI